MQPLAGASCDGAESHKKDEPEVRLTHFNFLAGGVEDFAFARVR